MNRSCTTTQKYFCFLMLRSTGVFNSPVQLCEQGFLLEPQESWAGIFFGGFCFRKRLKAIYLQFTFTIFYCCFIFVAKERFPKILVEINLGLCSIEENSIFSCIQFIHLVVIT